MKKILTTINLIIVFLSNSLFAQEISSQTATYLELKNQLLPMSDNINLAYDLYLPNNKPQFSTILIRTPYGKAGASIFAKSFAEVGYAVVIQDVRGKNRSEGIFSPFVNERQDGLETLDWIIDQPWSNGKVAAWGSSYLGFCALILTDANHPALKSVFNLSGWIDGNRINNPGGALHQMLIIPWLLSDGQTSVASEKGLDLEEMFAYRPLRDAIPGNIKIFNSEAVNISKDKNKPTKFKYKNVDIPILHINGWHDFTIQASIDAYNLIRLNSKIQQHLIVGPWYHNQIYDDIIKVGDYQLPKAGVMTMHEFLELSVDWFDTTLENKKSENFYNPVEYYVFFSDVWKVSQQWPPKHELKTLFLHDDKLLLETKNLNINSKSHYQFNPQNPTPTLGGANFYFFGDKMGIINQELIEKRQDVLVYTSNAFTHNEIIAGEIGVELFVQSEGISTDFTVKLTLVNKQDVSQNITDNIIRLSKEDLIDSITKVKINLGNTAFQVLKGEKIRIQISSSNYPKFNLNPNTGEDPLDALVFKAVKQTIFHSKKYPSKITLPVTIK